jgi:beta-lactamase class A
MKVMIMMDYYREKQLDQSIMQKNLTYSEDINKETFAVSYATPTNLTIGQNYSIQYLVEDMVENSDDGAATLLLANDNPDILKAVYRDLNILAPGDSPSFTISSRNYTLFLRILYNATYLSEKNSENALSIMSQSTYKDGISAGLPSDIVVAQKYGEDIDTDPQGKEVTGTELHNCGIVYTKDYPYTLCIMTKAKGVVDQKQLASIIKDISKMVYDYVNSGSEK